MNALRLLSAVVLVHVACEPCHWMLWTSARHLRSVARKVGLDAALMTLLWAGWFSLEALVVAAVASGRHPLDSGSVSVTGQLLVSGCFAFVTFDKMELNAALLTLAPRGPALDATDMHPSGERRLLAATLPWCWAFGLAVFFLALSYPSPALPPTELAASGIAGLFRLRIAGFFVLAAGLIGLLGHALRGLMLVRHLAAAVREAPGGPAGRPGADGGRDAY